ncbi:hypothetical protein ACJIZ3_019122 [Penstemon smallii]|uniref:Uncharacterized protein n=1 Tax=Penstemon smallii TaxID=265156 RepID=A0ABD3T169_9LAMI
MTISNTTGDDEISEAEDPLLDKLVVGGFVDYKGRPSVRSKSGCWKSSAFIIGVGVGERFAYYGISSNLVSYLTGPMGQSTAAAAAFLNAWYGTASLLPILGAFVADSYSGRYATILVACVLYISGLIFLTLSASINTFKSSKCKRTANNTTCSPSELQLKVDTHLVCKLLVPINLMTKTAKNAKLKAHSSIDNLSWELGFGIPAVVMGFSLVMFLVGTPTYRFRINSDGRNPFVRISRVFVRAARNWRVASVGVLSVDEEVSATLPQESTDKFKFLDKALSAASMEDEKFCSIKDVEDAKSILRLVPIWCTTLGYSIIFAQPSTLFTKQANTMDRYLVSSFKIPAASLQQYFIGVSLIVFIPIYDRVFVPIARSITKKPSGISMLQRIRIGLFLSLVSIVFAAFVERKRLATAIEYGLVDKPNDVIPMSAWWLAPQYVLSGIADVFAMIGLQEFFYEQVPCDLKSIGLAMYLSIFGIGSLLSSFLVSFIENATKTHGQDGWFADNLNRAHLDYFYWLLTGLSVVGFTAYIYFARGDYFFKLEKMTISNTTGDNEISDAEAPLLDDLIVGGSVDYKGRPSIRSKSGCWKSSAFIVGVGVAERFAYYGISSNLISYLTGSMGQSTAAAAAFLDAWYGTAALLPILGAFVADSYTGRYRTILVSCVLYISTANNTTCSPTELQSMFFYFSLYLVALAQGGYSPCVQAFGADQFDDEDNKECKAKSSFFNWWNCFSSIGVFVPLLVLTYIQENLSWELGFGIPAVVMGFTLVMFLVGTPTYRFRINSDGRNPFVRISRVFVKAARNWRTTTLTIDEEDCSIIPQENNQFKFLDKSLSITAPDDSMGDGKCCSINDVEDAKSILRLVPIWCTTLGYSIVFAQPSTLFTKQATTMDRCFNSTFQLPAASLQQCFITGSHIIFIPLYDRVFVPIARAITKKPAGISMLQRIGIGLFLSLVSIVFAAFVEGKRLATAIEYGLVDKPNATVPMSALWLAPQYALSGIADVFTLIGLQEFFYEQVPCDLKSIGLAMYLSIFGIGSLLSSFLVSFIENATKTHGQDGWFADNLNRAHLDYFYWLLTGLSVVGFTAYIYFARSYVYRRRIST